MSNDAAYQRLAMRIFADFSGTIAVPAVLAAFLGKWLDGKYHTAPTFLILCLVMALAATVLVIVRKAKRYSVEYERLNKNV